MSPAAGEAGPMFRYETHMHTSKVSRCAHAAAQDMIRACQRQGYDGAIITDHFLQGNSHANISAPWPQRVSILMEGYRRAKAVGDEIGLAVFLGWEATLEGHDLLTYGLDEDFLLANPDLSQLTCEAYCRRVHQAGGFVSQAHPYREAFYVPRPGPIEPALLDAVEVFNGGNLLCGQAAANAQAHTFAQAQGLLFTAGSDAHNIDEFSSGMGFSHRLRDAKDLLEALTSGQGTVLMPGGDPPGHY